MFTRIVIMDRDVIRKQWSPLLLLTSVILYGLAGVVDARCTGVELVVDGQVYTEDVLYKPMGHSGVFVTCQNCDDNINRPTWYTPSGTRVPSCQSNDVAVCYDQPSDTSRDLVYSAFKESSGGRYECRVGGGLPKSVNIVVLGPPVITRSPTSQMVASPNTQVTLNCEAFSIDGSVQYLWERKGYMDDTNWTTEAAATTQSTSITTNPSVSQQYRCVAMNIAGRAISQVANITVFRIVDHPKTQFAGINSTVRFTCRASVSNNITFTWTHKDKLIFQQILSKDDTSTLTISKVDESAAGRYACFASNNGTLTIFSDPANLITVTDPPVIIVHPLGGYIPIGNTITLQCGARGLGLLAYTWERRQSDQSWVVISGDSLTTYNTTTDGFYRCSVENEAGSVVSNVTRVHVYGPPMITVHPMGGDIPMGHSVALVCQASGRGILVYSWERMESGGDWAIVDNSNATNYITSVNGLYRCNVSNEAGSVVSNSATVNVYGPPEVLNHPIGDYVPMGRNMTLMCRASGLGTLVYSWERSSSGSSWTTVSNDNTTSYTTNTTLTIGQYMYRCRVSNEAGSVMSNSAAVNVYGPPVITDHPTGDDVPMGRSITLMCRASGLGTLVYSWERSNSGSSWTTVSNDNTTSYTTDTTLTIGQYMYRCRVSNEAGSTFSNGTQVDYYGVPLITAHPSGHLATVGMNVTLSCEGSGKGMLNYHWENNLNNVGNSWTTVSGNNKTYTIQSVQESEQYKCVVGNEVGNTTSNPATITILEITTHPQDRLVPDGSSVSLTCTSSVSSNVTFSWTHNGRDVTGQSTSTGDTSILTITNVRSSDDGSYVCTVRSGSLSVMSNTATLTTYGSPVITAQPSSVDVPVGNNFTLTCQANGHGSLLFSWERFSGGIWSLVDDDNTTKYSASTKTDGQVTYRCIVTNEAGSVTSDVANIIVYGPPSVQELPQQVHIVSGEQFEVTCTAANHQDSPMNLTFSWETPNGVLYNYTTTDEDDNRTASSTLHISSVVHSGEYRCVVAIGGTLSASTSTNIIVEVHSSRPQHLSVVSKEINSLVLRWRNPAHPHGNIDHFKVYYNLTGGFEHVNTMLVDSTYTLDNLRPYTEYSVYVTAVRLIGTTGRPLEGEKSRTVTTRTLAGNPIIVTNDEDDRPNKTINSEPISVKGHTIELPTITSHNGPFSHLYIVVHMISDQLVTDPESISTEDLLEESTKATPLFYVAGVVNASQYVPGHRMSYILGAGDNTTDPSGRVFYNREVEGTVLLFYRVFSVSSTQQKEISTTTNGQTRVFPLQQDVSSSDEDSSSGAGLVIGAVVAVLVIIILVIVVVIISLLIYRSRHSNSIATSKSSSPINDNAVTTLSYDKKSMSYPTKLIESAIVDSANPAFKIKLELSEVNSSVGQPTTLPIGLPDLHQPEVTWMKDEKPVNHSILADGSLYIINTDISDQGDYTVTVSSEGNTVSAIIKLTVTNPKISTNGSHRAVKVDGFADHLAMLKENKSAKLKEEFQKVSLDLLLTQHAAKLSCNKTKNRFINIMPYDYSRVVISQQDRIIGGDYINASYINGYEEPRAYIAAQGPVINSLDDFWRMIWEHNVTTVVMVTRLVEDSKIKCRQYWPDSGSTTYGSINVLLHKEENRAYYSVRHFHVKKVSNDNDNEVRVICQLHFTAWPDHGLPSHATALLDFQRIVDGYHRHNTGNPMLVHCSAGVGRTGSFIAIDTEIQRIQKESIVNVLDCVYRMRYQRNHMVQTTEQYAFVYTALLEYITCSNTSISGPVKSAIARVDEFFAVNMSAEKSELQLQFEKLMMIKETLSCTMTSSRCSIDCTEMVVHKPDGSFDQINAFYINGYHKHNVFIVAPEPVQSTGMDFWTMVWENKSRAVVMLGQLAEDKEKALFNCCNENSESENFVCEVTSVEALNEEIVQRSIKLTNTRENMSLTITHFEYMKWPQHSCPDSPTPMVDLIKELERIQHETGDGPITITCSDGIGCCGTLCALMISRNQFKAEQLFDVFKTVHMLHSQRSELVENLEQYEYIHRALVAGLQENSL